MTISPHDERPTGPTQYTTHAIFFPAGITVIEYLTNLDQIGVARCRFFALPLALEGADGSPVRAIAITE
jgi:arylformamidase